MATVAVEQPRADAVVVMLVDTPGVGADVVRRLIAGSVGEPDQESPSTTRRALGRASYAGSIGHPVLIGRDHWSAVIASAQGDRGARDYLSAHDVTIVECGDIGSGNDIDTREAFVAWLGE
jgi:CTP:molybdopterin cytidylyltransferase MocA